MRVGLFLPLGERDPGVFLSYSDVRALAVEAEAAGLDSVWVYDHLLKSTTEDAESSPWEAWTILSALADATSRVDLGALVFCTAFRHPGVMARMADTLNEVSDGRLILGLGSGWHQAEFAAFGLPFDHKVGRFAEALEITATMLREDRATVHGTYFSVTDAPIRVRPNRPVPQILIGGAGPRILRLTAQYADQWNLAWFGLPGDRFREVNATLDKACLELGREPASLARTVGIRIAKPTGGLEPGTYVPAEVSELTRAFAAWEAEGVSELQCWCQPSDLETVRLIAEARAAHRG